MEPSKENVAKNDYKVCRDYTDKCFTRVVNEDKVERGCLKEFATNKTFPRVSLDQDISTLTLRTCSTPMCNEEDVKKEYCITCDSNDDINCRNNVTIEMQTRCPLTLTPSGCFHYVDPEKDLVRRGCVAEVDSEKGNHKKSTDYRKECFGKNCNDKPGFLQCLTSKEHIKTIATHYGRSSTSQVCEKYGDVCFTYVGNNTVRRGCLSDAVKEIGADFKKDCANSDVCVKCSDSNDCNDIEIQQDTCITCDSETMKDCVFNPLLEMQTKCPLSIKPNGCFMWKDDKFFVRRGCIADVDIETQNICRDNSTLCKMCTGLNCNMKVTFQVCHGCNTSYGNPEKCIDIPYSADDIICKDYYGECYTHVVGGNVTRGCIGDDKIPDAKDCSDPGTCLRCSKKRCNNEPLVHESCVSCDSNKNSSCAKNSTFISQNIEQCSLSATPLGCYHIIDPATNTTKRGCVKNLNEAEWKKCKENPDVCKTCFGENCNKRKSFEKCFLCSTADDPNCAWTPKGNETKICKDYHDECFTFIGQAAISRGCLNELSQDFKRICRSDVTKCNICSSRTSGYSNCNDVIVNIEKCFECDSNNDGENCRQHPQSVTEKLCSRIDADGISKRAGCFLSMVGDHVKRGCIHDLPEKYKRDCLKSSNTCKHCMGKNCNKKPSFQKCYDCNSRDDPECARNVTMIKTNTCKEYLSTCITGIDAHGYTHRRCNEQTIIDQAKLPNGFEVCSPIACNSQVYPRNRLQCHQCDGNGDCNLLPNETSTMTLPSAQPCDVLSPYDQCFTYLSEGIF